jgi:hypothetical protein
VLHGRRFAVRFPGVQTFLSRPRLLLKEEHSLVDLGDRIVKLTTDFHLVLIPRMLRVVSPLSLRSGLNNMRPSRKVFAALGQVHTFSVRSTCKLQHSMLLNSSFSVCVDTSATLGPALTNYVALSWHTSPQHDA